MTAQPVHFDGPGGAKLRQVPPIPERTPQALRLATQEHAPHLLPDFEAHWRRAIGDAFNLTPVPAFLRLWWTQYAFARDPAWQPTCATSKPAPRASPVAMPTRRSASLTRSGLDRPAVPDARFPKC
ncbi:hypothetical protein ACFW9N_40975 [Streptomyces sp. NPDC059496]|uniref:hypothetical protein n=1 Tax=Streptomyces sp. NPDC059496 TaxID=3346851 RepID=UPI0036B8D1C8